MKNLFRRLASRDPMNMVNVQIDRLPEVRVKHVIERKIPRPTSITFQVHRADGCVYRLMPVDLSWKVTQDIPIPLGAIFQDHTMEQLMLRAELHYDPKDQA